MKKFMLCVMFFLVFCVGTAYFMEANSKPNVEISTDVIKKEKNPPQITPKKCIAVENDNKNKYEIKEYDGIIAIFKSGSNLPVKTTSISVDELPEADQKMLSKGIKASTEEELNLLLEDYCS